MTTPVGSSKSTSRKTQVESTRRSLRRSSSKAFPVARGGGMGLSLARAELLVDSGDLRYSASDPGPEDWGQQDEPGCPRRGEIPGPAQDRGTDPGPQKGMTRPPRSMAARRTRPVNGRAHELGDSALIERRRGAGVDWTERCPGGANRAAAWAPTWASRKASPADGSGRGSWLRSRGIRSSMELLLTITIHRHSIVAAIGGRGKAAPGLASPSGATSELAMLPWRLMLGSLGSYWRRGTLAERAGYIVGLLLMVSGLVHFAILGAGGDSWEGPLSLRKPMTFGLSFGLTLVTIVWVAASLKLGGRPRAVLLVAFSAACVLETALVSLQAWRGMPSHFNIETPFDASVARTLAAGGVTLVLTIFALTLIAFRTDPTVPISLRVAVRLGLIALLGAQIVGAGMIAKGMGLVFAGDPRAAYAAGGMLKPTHAVAMHAIQALLGLAWLLSFIAWSERRRVGVVLIAAIGYGIVAGVVAVANVNGLGPLHLPLAMAVPLAVGVLLLIGTSGLVLVGVTREPTCQGIQHG